MDTVIPVIAITMITMIIIIIIIIIFSLEISVIRSAENKLSIIREICICLFSLYIETKF